MDTWGEMARDCFTAAQKLRAEGHLRSSVSRSYYAAYSAVSGELASRGIQFAHGWNNPSHEQIVSLIQNGLPFPVGVRRRLLTAIRRLRLAREGADYRPGLTTDHAQALACLHDAMHILRALELSDD